ncbi:hypothetical protein [Epibacterium ulvae]|uniref:hypothetical protein n=1 Tax=Epibacterium ulvae TaxID=1156985 RepID=UPI002492EF48|nr:hypothetical protein [Epibacterium ulvae]
MHITKAIPLAAIGFAATILTAFSGAALGADVKRSEEFSVFWPQLRLALLNKDVEALDVLALSSSGIPFRYDTLDPSERCERQVLTAYLEGKLNRFLKRPGGDSFKTFLKETPVLDLTTHPDIGVNAIGEYDIFLSVRFARNRVDNAWDLVDMLDDLDRVYKYSTQNGGPSHC